MFAQTEKARSKAASEEAELKLASSTSGTYNWISLARMYLQDGMVNAYNYSLEMQRMTEAAAKDPYSTSRQSSCEYRSAMALIARYAYREATDTDALCRVAEVSLRRLLFLAEGTEKGMNPAIDSNVYAEEGKWLSSQILDLQTGPVGLAGLVRWHDISLPGESSAARGMSVTREGKQENFLALSRFYRHIRAYKAEEYALTLYRIVDFEAEKADGHSTRASCEGRAVMGLVEHCAKTRDVDAKSLNLVLRGAIRYLMAIKGGDVLPIESQISLDKYESEAGTLEGLLYEGALTQPKEGSDYKRYLRSVGIGDSGSILRTKSKVDEPVPDMLV